MRLFHLVGVTAIFVASCGSSGIDDQAATTTSVATTRTSEAPPESSPPTTEADGLPEGIWVATATGNGVHSFVGATDATDPEWWFPSPTQFGGDRVFLVLDAKGDYLQVQTPVQPNGSTGWIRQSDVTLSEVMTRAEVNLADNSLTVWDGDEVIVETGAAVGKPATPTPLGRFFIRDVIEKDPNGAYGSFILGLSGFSETLESFNGGLPAIAIHGTNQPELLGQEVSNGCIRIPNEWVELLADTVPLGTPVEIVG